MPKEQTAICTTFAQYREAIDENKRAFFFAVEGAGLLNGHLDRLSVLYDNGVRFLTPVWRDSDCIGGAFNTDEGLTPFGREVVGACFEMGIVPDLSHASDVMTREILAMAEAAGKPVIATHSNSRAVCAHKRNLTDETATKIAALGGVFGLNLVPFHLADDSSVSVETVCDHVMHFLSIGLGDAIAMGGDLDGMDHTPQGIRHIGDLSSIARALSARGVGDTQIEKIFCDNAEQFLTRVF
jgi:membrane dipeptidase